MGKNEIRKEQLELMGNFNELFETLRRPFLHRSSAIHSWTTRSWVQEC